MTPSLLLRPPTPTRLRRHTHTQESLRWHPPSRPPPPSPRLCQSRTRRSSASGTAAAALPSASTAAAAAAPAHREGTPMVPTRDREPGPLRRPQSLQSLTPPSHDAAAAATMLPLLSRRPESVPDLPLFRAQQAQPATRVPAKLLLNVTVQRSLGPVQVIISPGSTVSDLVRAAVAAYVKEGRRPLLPGTDPSGYELHYSQFSLESLDPQEKLINLGSRNFFLCSKQASTAASSAAAAAATVNLASDCRRDEGHKKKTLLPRLMDSFAKH